MSLEEIFQILGIPADYGIDKKLPRYEDAVDIEEVEINFSGRMQSLAPPAAASWRAMKQAAAEVNIDLQLVSGFRSIVYQTGLLQNKLAAGQSIEAILQVNAAPGYSQHHTGLAVDVTTSGVQPLSEEFDQTEAFKWLRKNAGRYGFSMPYRRGNKFGFCYEPWHWSQVD